RCGPAPGPPPVLLPRPLVSIRLVVASHAGTVTGRVFRASARTEDPGPRRTAPPDATRSDNPGPVQLGGHAGLEGGEPDGRRGVLDRYREPDADEHPLVGGVQDGCHDADHLAVHRDQRAAGVARIGGGVELDEIRQETLAAPRLELTVKPGDHA